MKHDPLRTCSLLLVVALAGPVGWTAETADLDARLARLPRPWTEKIHRLTLPEYEATLRHWANQHPDKLRVERRGESHDRLPVYLVRITDSSVADEDKQVALVSALHAGPELSGTTSCLRLIEHLLGDTPEARDTRRKQ